MILSNTLIKIKDDNLMYSVCVYFVFYLFCRVQFVFSLKYLRFFFMKNAMDSVVKLNLHGHQEIGGRVGRQ